MEIELRLYFAGDASFELVETLFCHPAFGEPLKCVRGKTSGAYHGAGVFQWTTAVKALSLLMLKGVAYSTKKSDLCLPILKGSNGSLASSLDDALHKTPSWLTDMFGTDSRGQPLVRRVFLRTNPGRRRPGCTMVSINERFLPLEGISVFWEGRKVLRFPDLTGMVAHMTKTLRLDLDDASIFSKGAAFTLN